MIICIKKQNLYNIIFTFAIILAFAFLIRSSNETALVSSTPVSGKTIIIDPGHGFPDGGASGVSGVNEKDLNLSVAKKLGNLLWQSGANVIYTREDDNSIADNLDDKIHSVKMNDMKKRKKLRDESGADLYLSIHMNIGDNSTYRGAQVFYNGDSTESFELAKCIQESIKAFADKSNTREAKNSGNSIYILNDSKIPAVLVECGFISNPEEEARLKTDSYQDEIAYSIYAGVLKYIN